jgi:hypothetical protein
VWCSIPNPNRGMKLVVLGIANVGGIVDMGMGSGVYGVMEVLWARGVCPPK